MSVPPENPAPALGQAEGAPPPAPQAQTPRAPVDERTRLERFRSWRFAPLVEIILTIALALGLAESVQAAVVKPFVIPSASMEPTLPDRPAGARQPPRLRLRLTPPGDIVVFHPPTSLTCAVAVPGDRAVSAEQPPSGEPVLRQARHRGARRPHLDRRWPPGDQRQPTDERALHPRHAASDRCTIPARSPSRRASTSCWATTVATPTTAASGGRSPVVDHRRGLRDLLATRSDRLLLSVLVQVRVASSLASGNFSLRFAGTSRTGSGSLVAHIGAESPALRCRRAGDPTGPRGRWGESPPIGGVAHCASPAANPAGLKSE